jgi:hypothetical protein
MGNGSKRLSSNDTVENKKTLRREHIQSAWDRSSIVPDGFNEQEREGGKLANEKQNKND